MKNASPSNDSNGSMIDYWEEQTKIDLNNIRFKCPKCKRMFERKDLHGAHVVKYILNSNQPQFITPLCKYCNEGNDSKPFLVRKEFVVDAPNA